MQHKTFLVLPLAVRCRVCHRLSLWPRRHPAELAVNIYSRTTTLEEGSKLGSELEYGGGVCNTASHKLEELERLRAIWPHCLTSQS